MRSIKNLPLFDELHNLFIYNSDTGQLIWKNCKNSNLNGSNAGTLDNSDGYIRLTIHGTKYLAHRIIWKMQYNEEPSLLIDHINGVRSDNRLTNLRILNQSLNCLNTHIVRCNNTIGERGISWRKKQQRWIVQLQIPGNKRTQRTFKQLEDAIIYRDSVLKEINRILDVTVH